MDDFSPYPLGNYFLLAKIARGGMAEIFVAADASKLPEVDKIVIKRLLQEFSDDKRFVSMLIDEAKITSLLEHPNIVKIYDVGSVGRDFYISLEFVEGISLDRLIAEAYAKKKAIPFKIITFLAERIGKALDYAHNFKDSEGRPLNLVHRDVTPGNILLSFEGEIKLADFGIATASRDSIFQRGEAALGKKFYMPPEQLKNLPVDRKTDIYALGAVIYEILTGHKIFDVTNEIELQQKIISEDPLPPSTHNPSARIFDDFILKSLSKNPKDRHDTALDFIKELTSIKASDNREYDNLKLFIWELFSDYKMSMENTIENSIKAMHEYDWDKDKSKASSHVSDPQHVEKTEFITHDYKESKTSFLTKDEIKTQPPEEIKKEIITGGIGKAPIVKIKTKKVTPEELHKIRKGEIEEMREEGALHQNENMTFILPAKEQKDEKKKLPEKPPIEKPDPPPPEEVSIQEPVETGLELDLPEDIRSETKEETSYDLESEISREKRKIVKKKKLSLALKRSLALTFAAILLGCIGFAVFTYLRNMPSGRNLPKMNMYNPATVSVILYSDKPGKYEKKILPRILSTKTNDRYDNFGLLESFLKNEYKRYSGKEMDFLNLSFIGPIIVNEAPPLKQEFWNSRNVLEYFEKITDEEKIALKDKHIKIYVYFYRKKPEEPQKYPLIYKGPLLPGTQIVFLPLIKEEINSSIILLTSRILAAFGATEKLDRNLNPSYPDGLAEPAKNPVYPQQYAEIMARYIPESADSVRLAPSLAENRIGPKTALEIGWIDKKTYRKLTGIK